MKTIELGKINNTYAIRIEREDQIIEELKNFADQYLKTSNGYRFAEFNGLGGGIKNYKGYFSQVDAKVKEYAGPAELLKITGNITTIKGKENSFISFVHVHVTFGDKESEDPVKSHRASGFHLVEGTVGLTVELTINTYDKIIERSRDNEGLPLILSSVGIGEEGSDSNKTELDKLRKEKERLEERNEKLEKENTELKNQSSTALQEQIKRLNKALIDANEITQKANETNQQLIARIQVKP